MKTLILVCYKIKNQKNMNNTCKLTKFNVITIFNVSVKFGLNLIAIMYL